MHPLIGASNNDWKCTTCLTILFLANLPVVLQIAIDNEVIGEPELSCLDDMIMFTFKTKNSFRGRIFVKGRSNDPNCVQDLSSNAENNATYTIHLGDCGMQKFNQGADGSTTMLSTVVVSFHQIFVTKVDRAYKLQCSFQEVALTVTQNLGVSMIPDTAVSGGGELPTCSYALRSGGPDGEEIRYSTVGEKAVHVWECSTRNPENYGLLVYDCMASDTGANIKVDIVDSLGCVVDPILMEDITYETGGPRAYASTHVYKYADQPSIFFQCAIRMCNKKAGECEALTPPVCDLKINELRDNTSNNKKQLNSRQLLQRAILSQHGVYKRDTTKSEIDEVAVDNAIDADGGGDDIGDDEEVLNQRRNKTSEESEMLTTSKEPTLALVNKTGTISSNNKRKVVATTIKKARLMHPNADSIGMMNLPEFNVATNDLMVFDAALDAAAAERLIRTKMLSDASVVRVPLDENSADDYSHEHDSRRKTHHNTQETSSTKTSSVQAIGSTCVPSSIYIFMVSSTLMSFMVWTVIVVCVMCRMRVPKTSSGSSHSLQRRESSSSSCKSGRSRENGGWWPAPSSNRLWWPWAQSSPAHSYRANQPIYGSAVNLSNPLARYGGPYFGGR